MLKKIYADLHQEQHFDVKHVQILEGSVYARRTNLRSLDFVLETEKLPLNDQTKSFRIYEFKRNKCKRENGLGSGRNFSVYAYMQIKLHQAELKKGTRVRRPAVDTNIDGWKRSQATRSLAARRTNDVKLRSRRPCVPVVCALLWA